MNGETRLTTTGLAIGYPRPRGAPRVIAEGIGVTLRAGEFVCLLGPNGAGKSTLLRTLSGTHPALAGTIQLAGQPLAAYSARALAQRMSLVLTQRVAVGMMSVAALVALGRHPYTDWRGRLRPDDAAATAQAIAAVGLEALAHRPVCELSDGERQKAMIARALAQAPQIMILDEATAFLDLPRRVELMQLLQRLAHESGRAILLSTHDLELALRCADRLWLLPRGGPLREGVPEDLVLNDAFAETFADAGVQFDKRAGAFVFAEAGSETVALCGDGLPAVWTRRALERAGYRVVPRGQAALLVEVQSAGDHLVWRIQEKETYRSLAALLAGLQRLRPTRAEGPPP